MDFSTKVKMALAYLNISQAELARRLKMSPPALNQRMKRGKWTQEDMEQIAHALGATFTSYIEFEDGTRI